MNTFFSTDKTTTKARTLGGEIEAQELSKCVSS